MNDTYNLIIKAQSGDMLSMNALVESNSRLIWAVVKKYSFYYQEKDDLFQIGSIGFIKAVKRFNTELNLKLSTYAVPMINGEIKKFLRDNGPIKISRDLKALYIKYNKAKEQYYKLNGYEGSIKVIAKILEVDAETLILAINANESIVSLDKTMNSDSFGEPSIMEKIENPKLNPENYIEKLNLIFAVNKLENQDKKIIKLRYIENKTQSETGRILGISQVGISRLEKKILKKIRKEII